MIADLTKLLTGASMLPCDGLSDYHTARSALQAYRKHDFDARFQGVRSALRNYRVQVSYDGQGCIRIYRPDTEAKFWLDARD
jgi:hypothetical protein